ncbi:MAG: aminoacyl-tRNA hydrolase [Kofleriaceae bacterium]
MSWLVAGLGNPGSKYAANRHNIGFRVVEELARKAGSSSWKSGAVKGAETTTAMLGRARCVLVKPLEFMNLSGFAVQRAMAFHTIAIERLLVVHDEIDLDFGIVRLKHGGGHGGHNGLRSIMEQLGAKEGNVFSRLRMGVGRDPNKQPGSGDAAAWVLGDFPKVHEAIVAAMISAGCEDIETVIDKGIVPAMNQHNARSSLAPA